MAIYPSPSGGMSGGSWNQPKKSEPNGLAVASLVLGVIGLILSLVVVGGVLGLIGVLLGLAHIVNSKSSRTLAGFGVGISFFSIIASIGMVFVYYFLIEKGMEFVEDMEGMQMAAEPADWVGVEAPDATFVDLDGNSIALSSLRGKRVILDFWSEWDPASAQQIPHFIELRNTVPQEELAIIGVAVYGDDTLHEFATEKSVNYPLVIGDEYPPPYSDVYDLPTTFFIDRKGVIQTVLTGYHGIDELRTLATQADYAGELKPPPSVGISGDLTPTSDTLTLVALWHAPIAGAVATTGDWNLDGRTELLVLGDDSKLHIIDDAGQSIGTIDLPNKPIAIEFGRIASSKPVVLSYPEMGQKVTVTGADGKEAWHYTTTYAISGAHWADLDGDGIDEMTIGMVGFSGLHAVDENGKVMWKTRGLGGPGGHAAISGRSGAQPAAFLIELTGTIRAFSATGDKLESIRPGGVFYDHVLAGAIDGNGRTQVLATGQATMERRLVASDELGNVVWSTPIETELTEWRPLPLDFGDIDGDGAGDWAFMADSDYLVVASMDGRELLASSTGEAPKDLALLPSNRGGSIVVVLLPDKIQAYEVRPAQPESAE